MSKWYWRNGKLAVDTETDKDWAYSSAMKELNNKLGDRAYKVVKQETLPNGKWVSTVWLGLDMNMFDGDHPHIFETMVFTDNKHSEDLDMDRYSTEEEAIEGHTRMVEKWSKEESQ